MKLTLTIGLEKDVLFSSPSVALRFHRIIMLIEALSEI